MFIRIEKEVKFYVRRSKKGKTHPYKRERTVAVFECDDCHEEFKRDKGKVDPKRLDNSYTHVCPDCDPKRFAQKKGVEQRRRLNTTVDSLITIDEIIQTSK
jgi:hypothetical protein